MTLALVSLHLRFLHAHASHPIPLPQGELDLHKGEAARLRREMERVEGERERLREEARK